MEAQQQLKSLGSIDTTKVRNSFTDTSTGYRLKARSHLVAWLKDPLKRSSTWAVVVEWYGVMTGKSVDSYFNSPYHIGPGATTGLHSSHIM
jgi:hypothetical protein